MSFRLGFVFVILAFALCGWTLPCLGQSGQPTAAPSSKLPKTTPPDKQPEVQSAGGTIKGTVIDPTGAVIGGARVQLTGQSPKQETRSGADGQFSFTNVAAGAFQLTITTSGFALQKFSGKLQSGEIQTVPPIALDVAENVTEVEVELARAE